MLLKNVAASLRSSFFTVFVDMNQHPLCSRTLTLTANFASGKSCEEGGHYLAYRARVVLRQRISAVPKGFAANLIN